MGIKPQQPSFVALWPEQQKGDNERSVRSSTRIGWVPPPPETPDVMDLECRQGGRKERIWGGGRFSSLSQTKSLRDKPRCILEMSTRQRRVARFRSLQKYNPPQQTNPRTKATLPRDRDNSSCCKLLRTAFLSLPSTAEPALRLRVQAFVWVFLTRANGTEAPLTGSLSARGSQGSAGHSPSPPMEKERNNEGPGLAT